MKVRSFAKINWSLRGTGRRADAEAQNRAAAQFGHAGHHAIGGWQGRRRLP